MTARDSGGWPHRQGRSDGVEWVFLGIAGVLGLLLVFVSPPFRWGDENVHFAQAYVLSEGMPKRELVDGVYGVRVPAGVSRLIFSFAVWQRHSPDGRLPRSDFFASRSIKLDASRREFTAIDRLPYSPLSYLPQALGIALARSLSDSALATFFAARLANLAAWLALVWLALRVAPEFRWPMCVLALAPMGVFLAASCSADALANGLAFLWTAAVLRLAAGGERRIDGRVGAALAALAAALSLAKVVYGSLVLLLLLVPAQRFGGRSRRAATLAGLGAAAAGAVAAWFAWGGGAATQGLSYRGRAATDAHLSLIVGGPGDVLDIVARTAVRNNWGWVRQLVETHWGSPTAPPSLLWIWLGALAAALVADPPRAARPTPGQRLWLLGVAAVTWIAIILLAFLLWSPIDAREAHGVQGRYLIPLLPALLLSLAPPAICIPDGARLGLRWTAAILAGVPLLHTCIRGMEMFAPR